MAALQEVARSLPGLEWSREGGFLYISSLAVDNGHAQLMLTGSFPWEITQMTFLPSTGYSEQEEVELNTEVKVTESGDLVLSSTI